MVHEHDKDRARLKRHRRVRARVSGDAARLRLCIFRSLNHLYVQAVDDQRGQTVATASTLELRGEAAKTGNVLAAKKVGELIAARLKEKGLETVVFDRGGYLYHRLDAAVVQKPPAGGGTPPPRRRGWGGSRVTGGPRPPHSAPLSGAPPGAPPTTPAPSRRGTATPGSHPFPE